MKNIFICILFFMNITVYSSVINHNQIDSEKHVIQVAVFNNYKETLNLAKVYEKYKFYVEKLNKYTLYIVNIKTKDKKEVLSRVKKDFPDAFFIKKIVFFKLNNNISPSIDNSKS